MKLKSYLYDIGQKSFLVMLTGLFVPVSFFINSVHAAPPSSATGAVKVVGAGYSDGSVAFSLVVPAQNPAGCTQSGAYFIENNGTSAAQDALAVVMFAKSTGARLFVSIVGDRCFHPEGSDIANTDTFPIAQRVVIPD